MAGRKPPASLEVVPTFGRVGTCRVYGPGGEVLWERDGFRVGVDVVPRRLSMSMVAMQVVDPSSGERVAVWNPWGVLSTGS